MGRLFELTVPIEEATVRAVLEKHWEDAVLGDRIKASQNHTYKATRAGAPVILRLTPDPAGEQIQRIVDELFLINYLHDHGLQYVCKPIPPSTPSKYPNVVREGDLTVVMFEYAKGSPVNFADWKWISDEPFAVTWGKWAGQLHKFLKQFARDHPEVAGRFRLWNQIHDGVMMGAKLNEEDEKAIEDPDKFGVLHGDLNIGNMFWIPPSGSDVSGSLYVFDWDQCQRGWFYWDVAMILIFPYMLSGAGSWLDGSAVPGEEAYKNWRRWVVRGYEAGMGAPVDDAALERMLQLRKEFYNRFCRRAVRELEEDEKAGRATPELLGMKVFMNWTISWLDKTS